DIQSRQDAGDNEPTPGRRKRSRNAAAGAFDVPARGTSPEFSLLPYRPCRPSFADETAILAAGEQQRLVPVIAIGFHGAEEDDVISAVITIDGSAFKVRNAARQKRSAAETRFPVGPLELLARRLRELGRETLL